MSYMKLQQDNASLFTGLDSLGIPKRGLNLADMALAQQQHRNAGLADAAAHGQGQLVVQEHLMEGQLAAVIAAGQSQLTIQRLGADADALP